MGANVHFFSKSRSRLKASNFFSLWDFDFDASTRLLDKIGSNDLTLTGGNSGNPSALIGRSWNFQSQGLEANNDISLSFNDGVNDIEGGFSMLIKFDSLGTNQFILNKRDNFGDPGILNNEYQINHNGTNIQFIIFDQISGGNIRVSYPWTPTLNTWYQLQVYYDGSGLHTGLKMYIDGVSAGTTSLTGIYVNNQNYVTKFVMGTDSWGRSLHFDGQLDEVKKSKISLTDAEALELATKELAGIKVI